MTYEKTYPNEYKIVGDTDLKDGGTGIVSKDYAIVNPKGIKILHGSNLAFLEKIVGNPKWLKNAELDGGISG